MNVHFLRYECPREGCMEVYRVKQHLTWHINRHDRECCGTEFPTQKKYESHVEKNHSNKYHCGCCDDTFDKFADMQQHMAARHTKGPEDSLVQPVKPVLPADSSRSHPGGEQVIYFTEPSRSKSLPPPKLLKIGDTINRITGLGYEDRPIACPEDGCDRRFTRQYDLDRHVAASHNPDAAAADP
ncbi:hypothetical protein B9G98_01417 [Wickerhamiella sorbophila]|uniref:C2H2-type domain-containing protein n=1 Tax=Wickerhamiella sorbophila TaxID=45607 RepID=A0A2T0FFQ2_9ASCO|nr:hypothetical protein B9G98_01417 [Wickerhamiella sorbophila]PRT53797.1 hypothetical protein B9G98_01417 [Wickerhamiella sorbophila]